MTQHHTTAATPSPRTLVPLAAGAVLVAALLSIIVTLAAMLPV